jgi:hypothetical protein
MRHIKKWDDYIKYNERYDDEKLKVNHEIDDIMGVDYQDVVSDISITSNLYKKLVSDEPIIKNLNYKLHQDKIVFNLQIGNFIVFVDDDDDTTPDEYGDIYYDIIIIQDGERKDTSDSYDTIKNILSHYSKDKRFYIPSN